jgi:hypothetical protein
MRCRIWNAQCVAKTSNTWTDSLQWVLVSLLDIVFDLWNLLFWGNLKVSSNFPPPFSNFLISARLCPSGKLRTRQFLYGHTWRKDLWVLKTTISLPVVSLISLSSSKTVSSIILKASFWKSDHFCVRSSTVITLIFPGLRGRSGISCLDNATIVVQQYLVLRPYSLSDFFSQFSQEFDEEVFDLSTLIRHSFSYLQ